MERPNSQGVSALQLVLKKFEFIRTMTEIGRLDTELGGLVPDGEHVGKRWCEELCSLYVKQDCEGCPLAFGAPGSWKIGGCLNQKFVTLLSSSYYLNWAMKRGLVNPSLTSYFDRSLRNWIDWLKAREQNLHQFV